MAGGSRKEWKVVTRCVATTSVRIVRDGLEVATTTAAASTASATAVAAKGTTVCAIHHDN